MSRRLGPGVLIVALAAGCAEEVGPESPPTTRIAGRVTLFGRPVAGGWLEMMPVDGTLGPLRSAPIRADGRFEADGVPVGRLAVRLAAVSIGPTGDPLLDRVLREAGRGHLFRFDTRGPADSMQLDLADEARRLLRAASTVPSDPPAVEARR